MPVFSLYINDNLCYYLLCDRVAHPHSLYWFSNGTDLVNQLVKWLVDLQRINIKVEQAHAFKAIIFNLMAA